MPSLLTNVHQNAKAGYDRFALFEINKFHTKLNGLNDEGVPKELEGLAFIISTSKKVKYTAFYEAKQYLEYIAKELGREFTYEPLEDNSDYPVTQPFEPKRSARVWDTATHERIGVIGEFKTSVSKAFKLSGAVAGFEISPLALLKLTTSNDLSYKPLSKYPFADRDISFQVSEEVLYDQVYKAARNSLESTDVQTTVVPLDIYVPDSDKFKTVTLRITLSSYDKTLTGDEVRQIMTQVADRVITETHGKVI